MLNTFSKLFRCYVGPNEDQWRPCSEKYYPYHQHKIPHPSQAQDAHQGSGYRGKEKLVNIRKSEMYEFYNGSLLGIEGGKYSLLNQFLHVR